jgi:uncharacterized membrane-anchored protein
MSTRFRWFVAVVALQAIFLLGWAGRHEYVRRHAPTILLRTQPVDPQDLLRGDYMILGYEIGRVTIPAGIHVGEPCWVVLAPDGEFHKAVRASATEPSLQPGELAVRARRGSGDVLYGIENYYVPEGMGTPRFNTLVVEASVNATQRLFIKRVLLDGKPYP